MCLTRLLSYGVCVCVCVQQENQNEARYLREHRGELVEELAKTIVEKVRGERVKIHRPASCCPTWTSCVERTADLRSSGCKPQLRFSQIINRKKTLADTREEYDQELLSERRTDHRLASDEVNPKQKLWVQDTMSHSALQHP